MYDKRLIGTWRSNKRRTVQEIRARRDIRAGKGRTNLEKLFGRMTVRYTRSRYYIHLNGVSWSETFRVVAKNSESVVVVGGKSSITGEDYISHIHFEELAGHPEQPMSYWLVCEGFREYFRRVLPRRAKTRKTSRRVPRRA